MRAMQHFEAGEKALNGAKELLRKADEEEAPMSRAKLLDSAQMLVGIANVHANLSQAASQANTAGLLAGP